MRENLYPKEFLALSQETRNKIREEFNVPKSGPTEVVNNVLVSDGTTVKDLLMLDRRKMGEYLNKGVSDEGKHVKWEETTIEELFELVVEKISLYLRIAEDDRKLWKSSATEELDEKIDEALETAEKTLKVSVEGEVDSTEDPREELGKQVLIDHTEACTGTDCQETCTVTPIPENYAGDPKKVFRVGKDCCGSLGFRHKKDCSTK